jgi:osmotically-inducible protein OsmY
MSRLPIFLLGAAAAAVAARYLTADRGAVRHAANKTKGVASTVTPSPARLEDPDDVTLARKVETEIFRDADVPKGQINVNAENGKIVLRGEVEKPELIQDLEKKTKKVQGVTEVENLLHTPGSPAPAK